MSVICVLEISIPIEGALRYLIRLHPPHVMAIWSPFENKPSPKDKATHLNSATIKTLECRVQA